ncbi:MAG: hypothetical protein ACRDP6_06920 [Actinoallomurus sp.]
MNDVDVREVIARAHHEEWARVVAALTRRFPLGRWTSVGVKRGWRDPSIGGGSSTV